MTERTQRPKPRSADKIRRGTGNSTEVVETTAPKPRQAEGTSTSRPAPAKKGGK